MKKIFILSFLVMFIIGCNKYNTPYNPNDIKQENSSFNNDYLYDEIYEIRDGKEIDFNAPAYWGNMMTLMYRVGAESSVAQACTI